MQPPCTASASRGICWERGAAPYGEALLTTVHTTVLVFAAGCSDPRHEPLWHYDGRAQVINGILLPSVFMVNIAADKNIMGTPAPTWFTIVTAAILTIVMFILQAAVCSNITQL